MTSSKIGILVGTNRSNSLSEKVAEYYGRTLRKLGCDTEMICLSELPKDFVFTALYQNAGRNEEFNRFQMKIDGIGKFVFVIPEYNGSFPGVLKTFMDGLRHPDTFNLKKVALVGISAGVLGNAVGLSHANDILSYMGADVLGLRVKLGLTSKHFDGTAFTLPVYEEFIQKQAKQLIAF